jgi:hypothetical protein
MRGPDSFRRGPFGSDGAISITSYVSYICLDSFFPFSKKAFRGMDNLRTFPLSAFPAYRNYKTFCPRYLHRRECRQRDRKSYSLCSMPTRCDPISGIFKVVQVFSNTMVVLRTWNNNCLANRLNIAQLDGSLALGRLARIGFQGVEYVNHIYERSEKDFYIIRFPERSVWKSSNSSKSLDILTIFISDVMIRGRLNWIHFFCLMSRRSRARGEIRRHGDLFGTFSHFISPSLWFFRTCWKRLVVSWGPDMPS